VEVDIRASAHDRYNATPFAVAAIGCPYLETIPQVVYGQLLGVSDTAWVGLSRENFNISERSNAAVLVRETDGVWVPAFLPPVSTTGAAYEVVNGLSAPTVAADVSERNARAAADSVAARAAANRLAAAERRRRDSEALALAREEAVKRREARVVRYRALGWSAADIQRIMDEKIWIGMSSDQLTESWGRPQRINETTSAAGTREQWVYSLDAFAYVDNGRVTSWQTSQ
jgi:hypothetical protein